MLNKLLYQDNVIFSDDHFGSFNPSFLLTERNIRIPDAASPEFLEESLRYSSTTLHESVHWFQFIGTNYGRMVLLMSGSRGNLFFPDESINILSSLLKDRPEIDIQENYNLNPRFLDSLPGPSALFLQDWLAHSISMNFLLNGKVDFEKVAALPHYIATALAFTYVCTNNFLNFDYSTKILDIEKKLTFPDLGIPRISENEILTVWHLMEGGARVSDLLHSNIFPFINRDVRENSFYVNDNSEYWKAWNVFIRIFAGTDHSADLNELIILFSILIEIALAIPFPPFVPSESLGKFTWFDLYPPIRFIKLCEKAASMELEIVPDDSGKMIIMIEKISHSMGYQTPLGLDSYFLDTYKNRLETIEHKWTRPRDYQNIELFDYYMLLFKKSAELRLRSPFAIANIAIAQSMPEIGDLTEVYLNLDQDHSFIAESPLVIDVNRGERKLHTPFHEKDIDIYQWILVKVVFQKIITEYLLFDQPVRSRDFPFDVPEWVKDMVKKNIFELFSYEIEWEE